MGLQINRTQFAVWCLTIPRGMEKKKTHQAGMPILKMVHTQQHTFDTTGGKGAANNVKSNSVRNTCTVPHSAKRDGDKKKSCSNTQTSTLDASCSKTSASHTTGRKRLATKTSAVRSKEGEKTRHQLRMPILKMMHHAVFDTTDRKG